MSDFLIPHQAAEMRRHGNPGGLIDTAFPACPLMVVDVPSEGIIKSDIVADYVPNRFDLYSISNVCHQHCKSCRRYRVRILPF